MYAIRRANDRGHFDYGWLKTYYTFSFGEYHDPQHHHFCSLRVMNEDVIAAGQGFGTHPHRDMEIVTYVLSGGLEHLDSMGNGEVLRAGELQRMSAGTGITHSEFNSSVTEAVHLYQIWLLPAQKGLEPSYEQKHFSTTERHNRLRLVASPNAADGSLLIHQDARLFLATLDVNEQVTHELLPERHAWLQVLRGSVTVGEHQLQAGDGLATSDEFQLTVRASSVAEIMLFDLA